MLIDTHSHLNFKAYDGDRDEVIGRLKQEGMICIDVGTKSETSKRTIELAEANDNIYAAIGMHPIHIKTDLLKMRLDEEESAFSPNGEDFDIDVYKSLAKNRRVVAIGEIGLDYYYKPKSKQRQELFKQKQKEIFIKQLDLSIELGLPVILHCRMAHEDLFEILKNRGLRGVVHCFTGNLQEAQRYIDLGFYIGINGIALKLDLDEVIKKVPLDKIVIETDCPYLTPPVEGKDKRNEPIFVKHVAQKIADLRGISFEEVAEKTTENAKKLFKI